MKIWTWIIIALVVGTLIGWGITVQAGKGGFKFGVGPSNGTNGGTNGTNGANT